MPPPPETFCKKSSVLESATFYFLPAFDFIFWWVWVLIFSNRQIKSCFKGRICGNKYCNGIDICKSLFDRKSEALQCSCIRDALREKHRKCGNLENFPHTIPSMQFIDILQFYILKTFFALSRITDWGEVLYKISIFGGKVAVKAAPPSIMLYQGNRTSIQSCLYITFRCIFTIS